MPLPENAKVAGEIIDFDGKASKAAKLNYDVPLPGHRMRLVRFSQPANCRGVAGRLTC
jgi:hypothetical protein